MSRMSGDMAAEDLLRELAPQVLGAMVRRFHDFGACEDAVQEALLAAALQWERDGLPDNPRGWLMQVARRRLTDAFRRESARRRRESQIAMDSSARASTTDTGREEHEDDSLKLFFMCCHPSLTPASAIALTLRAVGGLRTSEIARAYLVPEATMAQRISRAKQAIKESGVPFRMPSRRQWPQRLKSLLHVLYLIFSEGYTAGAGPDLLRPELSREAIRLTRLLYGLLPENGEVAGLLALMLLTDARRDARTGSEGELIPLNEQDRTLWDRAQIAEGIELLTAALSKGTIGPYQLQAAVAAVHDEAARHEDTDWSQILALYELLNRLSDNPMVVLNRAVAAAMVHGPSRGLELLEELNSDTRVAHHHRLHAVCAHLLEMAGEYSEAIAAFRTAAGRTGSLPERNYLLMKAARLGKKTTPPEPDESV